MAGAGGERRLNMLGRAGYSGTHLQVGLAFDTSCRVKQVLFNFFLKPIFIHSLAHTHSLCVSLSLSLTLSIYFPGCLWAMRGFDFQPWERARTPARSCRWRIPGWTPPGSPSRQHTAGWGGGGLFCLLTSQYNLETEVLTCERGER